MPGYNVNNWHWRVGGDVVRVWSSAKSAYIALDDEDYLEWCGFGNVARAIASEDELSGVLDQAGLVGPKVLPKYVDKEAYRRISTGFVWGGKSIQMRDEFVDGLPKNDQINIDAQAQIADRAVRAGAQAGDLNWCADQKPFAWRCADNSMLPLDAFQMIAMAEAAAKWKRLNVWAAGALKDASPTPLDFADNKYWPVSA